MSYTGVPRIWLRFSRKRCLLHYLSRWCGCGSGGCSGVCGGVQDGAGRTGLKNGALGEFHQIPAACLAYSAPSSCHFLLRGSFFTLYRSVSSCMLSVVRAPSVLYWPGSLSAKRRCIRRSIRQTCLEGMLPPPQGPNPHKHVASVHPSRRRGYGCGASGGAEREGVRGGGASGQQGCCAGSMVGRPGREHPATVSLASQPPSALWSCSSSVLAVPSECFKLYTIPVY